MRSRSFFLGEHMFKDLITYEVNDASEEHLDLVEVEFLRNFGPWSKGQKVEFLRVDYSEGELQEIHINGDVFKRCKFALTPA